MNDPRVEALYYLVKHSDSVDYASAEPIERETPAYTVRIADGRAEIVMKSDHVTADSARMEVEPFLRAWELTAALELGPGQFEFVYDRSKVVNRAIPATRLVEASWSVAIETAEARPSKYPDPPPSGIAIDEVVAQMSECYSQYRRSRRTLPDAANTCLTWLEKSGGGRSRAATRFAVAKTVLNKVGELAGEKGGTEARKAKGAGTEFTAAERQWLEQAIKRLILRAGEIAGNPSARFPQITMADLPPRA